jgi:Zn-dependent protease
VKWQALGVSLETRAGVSLAGPLAGWISAAVCLIFWWKTGDGLWAALARAGAWLNLINLIPLWVLDGGQAVLALGKMERVVLLTASVLLWFVLGESSFLFIAAGAGYRLFTRDLPETPSRAIAAYFLAVMVLLGWLLHAVPGHGFGMQ